MLPERKAPADRLEIRDDCAKAAAGLPHSIAIRI